MTDREPEITGFGHEPADGHEAMPVATEPFVDTERTRPIWDPRTGAWVERDDLEPVFGTRAAPPAPEPKVRDRSLFRAALAGGLAGALLAAAVVFPLARMSGRTVVERRVSPGLRATDGAVGSIVEIAERARPWVVNINVTGRAPGGFGGIVQGTGSGVILRSDGHIITNAHVVEGATEVEVTLATGERLQARPVGADPQTDIAVIRVERDDLPAAVIGTAKDLRVGELAVAIGSPLGLEQTVTSGIISALGRTIFQGQARPLVDMIQTDAPITQGNSGGALVNSQGAVIGINAAIAASPEVGAEGIAFAIPIDIAVAVANDLIETGRATHAWLGITGRDVSAEDDAGVDAGAYVVELHPNGPADRAGVRPDDIIVSFDGEEIDSMNELIVAIRERNVSASVQIVLVRDGERVTLTARLGDRPDDV